MSLFEITMIQMESHSALPSNLTINILIGLLAVIQIKSLIANLFVLSAIIHNNKLQKPINVFTLSLTFVNLISSIIYIPLLIFSLWLRRMAFGDLGCDIYGFILQFIATTTCLQLAVLSIERYCAVFRPQLIRTLNAKKSFSIVFVSHLFSILCCSLPLLGWSHYAYGNGKLFCTMNYVGRNYDDISYSIGSVIIFMVIPIIIIIYTTTKLYKQVNIRLTV